MNPTEQAAYATIDDASIALERILPDVQVFVDAPYGVQLQGYTALKDPEGVAVNRIATLAFDSAYLDAQLEVLRDAMAGLASGDDISDHAGAHRLAAAILARLGRA